MSDNIILLTDSYKVSHYRQYPSGTTKVYSYFESRGGDFQETIFFGLQYFLKRYLSNPITLENINEAQDYFDRHLGSGMFNRCGWEYILNNHGGKLPIKIKAVPEGTAVSTGNVLMTVENTDSKCFWLTNYLETLLSQIWYTCTVATISKEMKKLIINYLEGTGNPNLIDFKLHDFGFRGVSSVESAGIGGCAHLVNFKGTDTIAALEIARTYYNCDMAGFSIPAAEHSTITSWGKNREADSYKNMLEQFPKGLVAVVSDSYDIYNACDKIWGEELKDLVEGRDGTLVVRPDSGVPHEVVLKVLNILGDKFGFYTNQKGFKVLNDKVRVIQGDGINLKETATILEWMARAKWSADNIAFGMGGGLLQSCNRDTQKFAFKCSYVEVNGKGMEVFKSPIDCSWKTSKKGKLKLIKVNNIYRTSPIESLGEDLLITVFCNGELLMDHKLDTIRNISNAQEK